MSDKAQSQKKYKEKIKCQTNKNIRQNKMSHETKCRIQNKNVRTPSHTSDFYLSKTIVINLSHIDYRCDSHRQVSAQLCSRQRDKPPSSTPTSWAGSSRARRCRTHWDGKVLNNHKWWNRCFQQRTDHLNLQLRMSSTCYKEKQQIVFGNFLYHYQYLLNIISTTVLPSRK